MNPTQNLCSFLARLTIGHRRSSHSNVNELYIRASISEFLEHYEFAVSCKSFVYSANICFDLTPKGCQELNFDSLVQCLTKAYAQQCRTDDQPESNESSIGGAKDRPQKPSLPSGKVQNRASEAQLLVY